MEIFIEKRYQYDEVEIWACEETKDGRAFISSVDGKTVRTLANVNDCINREEIKPLLVMPNILFDKFLIEMSKHSQKIGVNTENENLLKGKLEATEAHLKDLQLAFRQLLLKISNEK